GSRGRLPDRLEARLRPVLLGDDGDGPRPVDAGGRVVVADAALVPRRVELADLVGALRAVGEGDEAVGEHLGDVQSQAVLGREVVREVLQVRGRVLAQVDDHVVDRAGRAAYELRLGGRRQLVVHAAQRAGDVVVGHVRLYDGGLE